MLLGTLVLALNGPSLRAAAITLPNFSFETPDIVYANAYDDGPPLPWKITISSSLGPQVGLFDNTTPFIDNADGGQVAYLFSGDGISIYQDLTGPGATFQTGQKFVFTIGAAGADQLPDGAQLRLRLYYRDLTNTTTDPLGAKVTVAQSNFDFVPPTVLDGITHLDDYSVTSAIVLAGDAWAGKQIGIEIATPGPSAFAYWDVDNVRLESVPEPTSLLLLALGTAGLGLKRLRRRQAA